MAKSIHRNEHQTLAAALRKARIAAGLTQQELGERLGRAQSFVSDVENGHRRLDLSQLDDICGAIGIPLISLVSRWKRAQKAN